MIDVSRKNDNNSIIKILEVIATNKNFPQSEIKKATGLSNKTIIETLKKMEKNELIVLSKKEASKKGGKDKKFYSPTWVGLHYAIFNIKIQGQIKHSEKELLESLIKNNREKLLTFEKWEVFKQSFLEDYIFWALKTTIDNIVLASRRFSASYNYKEWRHEIDSQIINNIVFSNGKSKNRLSFLKLCKKDSELNAFIQKSIADRETACRQLETIKTQYSNINGDVDTSVNC